MCSNGICSNSSSTRTPPHIKHKQEAVSPIQFFSPSHPKLARSLPRPLTGRARPTCSKHNGRLLCVSAYPVLLSSPQPSATSPSKQCPAPPPTPHSHPTASASAPLRHRCVHFHSIALAFSLPVLAAMLAFVTYTETSKHFDGAVLFLLRQPTMFLPRTLSTIADLRNALARLSLVFRAPLREGAPFVVDPEQEAAGWVWEEKAKGKKKEGGQKEKRIENEEEHPHEPDEQPPSCCTTSHSTSRAARSPPSSGA
ncbi:hypothetical protein B0H13DRAFT_2392941 [Mycena leptocephala]|nr:hypothetical protein B0H13DRAFT_2392941 [Mycena leptocephala]